MSVLIPAEFADLERFAADWALPTEEARLEKRLSADMESVKAFHDAMLPRLEAAFAYLDRYKLDALPAEARRLLCMTLSLAELAPSIHFYKGPLPADVLDPRRFKRCKVPNMTPQL